MQTKANTDFNSPGYKAVEGRVEAMSSTIATSFMKESLDNLKMNGKKVASQSSTESIMTY